MLSPLLLLPSLIASPCRPSYHSTQPRYSSSSSNIDISSSSSDNNRIIDFYIQQVTRKANALDVKVFRGFSNSAKEYVAEQHLLDIDISETQAVDIIMKNYHDNGDYMYSVTPHYGPETYFCAIYNGTEIDIDTQQLLFERTNGVVGVISAQLRKRPTPKIPTPHVYIANMRVDAKMKRRGIAMALLSAVQDYTKSLLWSSEEEELNDGIIPPMVLSVDTDNLPAIKLYEKFGFEYLDRNDEFCMMTL